MGSRRAHCSRFLRSSPITRAAPPNRDREFGKNQRPERKGGARKGDSVERQGRTNGCPRLGGMTFLAGAFSFRAGRLQSVVGAVNHAVKRKLLEPTRPAPTLRALRQGLRAAGRGLAVSASPPAARLAR